MAPAMELLDELTEEIFLRIHPTDAATLVRAALACKRWCGLIADPGFRRRFREFHRAPHMLGFNVDDDLDVGSFFCPPSTAARFIHTSPCVRRVDMERSRVLDTRHGRVLLHRASDLGSNYGSHWAPDRWDIYLFVWDPITKEEHELPRMPLFRGLSVITWNAAVFCTAAGCDHLDCHGKPFAVVFVATCTYLMLNFVYSSEAGRWSEINKFLPKQPEEDALMLEPSAFVGDAIYFVLQTRTKILKFNITTRKMSGIDLPPACFIGQRVLLMAMEDSVLGFATVRESKLYLWSREGNSDKDAGWVQRRAIDLKTLLPIGALVTPPDVVGFADGIGFIFLKTNSGHFRIDLKSGSVKKLHTVGGGSIIFPYMSFHTPALGAAASTGEGPSTGASSGNWFVAMVTSVSLTIGQLLNTSKASLSL